MHDLIMKCDIHLADPLKEIIYVSIWVCQ